MKVGAALDWPGRVLTLGAEIAALLFFAHRSGARILLLVWTGMHVAIWMFSGITFLVWIVLNLAFLALFFLKAEHVPPMFSRRHAIAGAALMLLSPLWLMPPRVGWFDTRLVYTYRYEAVDDRGNRAAFPADATPLGQAWCARDFPFLSKHPTVLVRYGKTNDRSLARAIMAIADVGSLFRLEEEHGTIYFDAEEAETLDEYLSAIAQNWNRRHSAKHWLSWASPPRTCLSPRSPPEPLIAPDRTVTRIIVHQLTFWFDGSTFRQIRRVPVRTIDVPAA